MAGYATSGRGWHNPAVAGLLRRDERVHAQSIELADCLCRVIASIGEMVRKSGVLFAANTLKAMSSWRRWAMRRHPPRSSRRATP